MASSATALPSPSSSTNPAETASLSPYFLPELIPLVASHLTTLQDFFALRAACRTYRDLLPPSPANLASQGPLLLFPHRDSYSGALFHAHLCRILRFRLRSTRLAPRDPSLTKFLSFGWRVAIVDRDSHDPRRELRIRHLLTGERACLPDPPKPRESEDVVFSGDLVVTFKKYCHVLYYCHIGDDHWRPACCEEGHQLYNLMFVKGTLYALIYPHYRLAVVELDKNFAVLSFLGDKLSVPEVNNCPRPVFRLAECRGELLLIVRVDYNPWVYMSSICNPGRGSGRGLLALVVAACSLIGMSLPVALVQIIRQFEGTACTSLGTLGSGMSILWLMGLIMNSSSTAQGQQNIVDLQFGSFQAFADAVQWGIITVQKFSRREINL